MELEETSGMKLCMMLLHNVRYKTDNKRVIYVLISATNKLQYQHNSDKTT